MMIQVWAGHRSGKAVLSNTRRCKTGLANEDPEGKLSC